MLGSKGILTPMIPDCSVLRTPAIIKNIHNSLIFLRKIAIAIFISFFSYNCDSVTGNYFASL